jgi:hypothetical protein
VITSRVYQMAGEVLRAKVPDLRRADMMGSL